MKVGTVRFSKLYTSRVQGATRRVDLSYPSGRLNQIFIEDSAPIGHTTNTQLLLSFCTRLFFILIYLFLDPQLNISNPATGAQKLIDVEDDKKLRPFMDKRISQEVEGSSLGDEWKVNRLNFFLLSKKSLFRMHFKCIFVYKTTSADTSSISLSSAEFCLSSCQKCTSHCMLDHDTRV